MKRFLLILAAACLIASCSKNDPFESGQLRPDAIKGGMHLNNDVIIVAPDQDGDGDDTDELTAAFAAAGPGTVIRLLEGEYHVGYIELYGFNGVIIGAGVEKTKINLKTSIDQASQVGDNQIPVWWRIMGGDITISGIAFMLPDGFLSDDTDFDPAWGSDLFAIFSVAHYNDEYYFPNDDQKLVVRNCQFHGGLNTDMSKDGWFATEFNSLIGIWVGVDYCWPLEGLDYPLVKGNFKFENCIFDNFVDAIEVFGVGENATTSISRCSTDNCLWPLFFNANYNSEIIITDNVFTNSASYEIAIEDFDWGFFPNTDIKHLRKCVYNITGNRFSGSPDGAVYTYDACVAINPEQRYPLQINIKNNYFTLNGSGPAISSINSRDLVVCNNKFTGSGSSGVLVNGSTIDNIYAFEFLPEVFAENALIQGNNFSGLQYTEAAVVLGERSMNCRVIGTGKEKVVNNGTDNKITGMKPVPGGHHMGPLKRQHMKMKPDMKK